MDLLLTNRRIPAAEALEMGLVSRLVAPERLAEEAAEAAGALARGATGAYGATRRLVAGALSAEFGEHLDAEARQLAAAAVSAEGREGVAAFLARRRPDFTHAPVP
jgi:2-(1,2-epoxy-1,2-dihydrophenyl)acetyl-CoA isomerase